MRTHIPKPDLHDPVQRLDPSLLDDPIEPPPPADEPLDDDEAQAGGQNWVEAMETTAIENGSDQPIDTLIEAEIGEDDHKRHPDRDTPVADRGAGGKGGIVVHDLAYAPRVPATKLELAGLTTRIVGPADAKTTVVLLHGFGAPGDDLVALAQFLGPNAPSTRFVFPEAPIELGGMYGDSRAWWLLDLARLEAQLRSGTPRDPAEIPDGLPSARAHITRLLDQLQARFSIGNDQLVVGGFSQGAMLSLDVALHRAAPPAGLILMSGTLVAEAEWTPRMPALKGVPIVMSHGKHDTLLPYAIAETLRDKLIAAGAKVDWHPFLGGHEIPHAVLAAIAEFLRARA